MSQYIDDILSNFELNQAENSKKEVKMPVTFWIPEKHKLTYDLIQCQTKKRFGKVLADIVIKSIEKIEKSSV